MTQRAQPLWFEKPAARCEYDDGNPGTILTDTQPAPAEHCAGDWVRDGATTYSEDGEAATISG